MNCTAAGWSVSEVRRSRTVLSALDGHKDIRSGSGLMVLVTQIRNIIVILIMNLFRKN